MPARPTKSPDAPRGAAAEAVLPFEFCVQASQLFRQHKRLDLRPDGLPVLLKLAEIWWSADRRPFAEHDLAARLGMSWRQLNPHLTVFEARGLIRRHDAPAGGAARYDLTGLFRKLRRLEIDAADANPLHA